MTGFGTVGLAALPGRLPCGLGYGLLLAAAAGRFRRVSGRAGFRRTAGIVVVAPGTWTMAWPLALSALHSDHAMQGARRRNRRTVNGQPDDRGLAVVVDAGTVTLAGTLRIPPAAEAIIVFAHGSGSSRHSARNRFVADALEEAGLATLLFDLLTEREEPAERYSQRLRFDIPLLSERLVGVIDWLTRRPDTGALAIGLFGASTGAAAAIFAAARRPGAVHAVVSRGGRPDLAEPALPRVRSPTLLIVGGDDTTVLALNRHAAGLLRCRHALEIVPGATHLFEEPGALERVAALARDWFTRYLPAAR